ncbi:MAG: polysaccharide pyruvyl transferase family protein [Pseudomonadaceae bacterium]|nr:polysaccharide pyruvyl transferase family protein [Pseudomonadaceae bacterium]
MKLAILNVKYSPNLGDAVIADCLEDHLRKEISNLTVFSLDIGGRSGYGVGGSLAGGGLGLMGYLKKMPHVVQTLVPWLVKRRYAADWKTRLAGCHGLIIGGGHLMMDVDQFFPLRLLTAVRQCPRGTPLFVQSVGVSAKMTARGLRLFKAIFTHGCLRMASVRDAGAQANWLKHFGGAQPLLHRDPGLLAATTYGKAKKTHRARPLVAFGVAAPASLSPHADSREGVVCGDLSFYLETLPLLAKQYDILLFTNGEDDAFLRQLEAELPTLPVKVRARIRVAPRPLKPAQLVALIRTADAMVGHRLHANIVAYSYRVPHIGLGWDDKLKSFFKSIDRPDFIITGNAGAPRKVAALVARALAEGIDTKTHTKVLEEARQGIRTLAAAIRQHAKRK